MKREVRPSIALSRRTLLKHGVGLGLAAVPLVSTVPRISATSLDFGATRATFESTARFGAVWAATDQAVANGSVHRT